MKNNKILFLTGLIICTIIFCSFSKNKNKTVKGYIHVYGNEPFTFIGIQTSDNKEYAILGSDEICSELRDSQGKLVQIEGTITPSKKDVKEPGVLKDGKIEVLEWKILN